ncbi:MAG: hypothetical protein JSR82_11995 [Verrucomicrobia bacterium]|nr:hypothetical protein [Verrucomicrobiota bacterium]
MHLRDVVRGALVLVVGGGNGCTFANLADYDVQPCEPVSPGVDAYRRDSCHAFNGAGGDPCLVWQCDARLRRCVQSARDDDRDGDPAAVCGGTDCDDANPSRSGRRADAPTATVRVPGGIGPGASVVLSTDSGGEPTATWVTPLTSGRYCLQATRLDASASVAGSCALLEAEPNLAPAQPFAKWIAGSPAAVFVAQTPTAGPCDGGGLTFRYGKSVSTASTCDASGAALPSLALGSDGAAVVAYYATAYRNRADVSKCPAVSPAGLVIRKVSNIASTSASFGSPQMLDAGVSFRPPALATMDGYGGAFVASPVAKGVGVWILSPATYSAGATWIDNVVADVVGVTMAATRDGGAVRLAIAKELGCNHGSLHLSLVEVDLSTANRTSIGDVEVTNAASAPAFRSSVSSVPPEKGGGWLVTWLAAGQAFARRFDVKGVPLTPPTAVPGVKALEIVAGRGEAFFVRAAGVEDPFYRAALQCP